MPNGVDFTLGDGNVRRAALNNDGKSLIAWFEEAAYAGTLLTTAQEFTKYAQVVTALTTVPEGLEGVLRTFWDAYPNAPVWLTVQKTPDATETDEIRDAVLAAVVTTGYQVRQILISGPELANCTTNTAVAAHGGLVAEALLAQNTPAVVISDAFYAPDPAVELPFALNMPTRANTLRFVIWAVGAWYDVANNASISQAGTLLGVLARATTGTNVGHVAQFNLQGAYILSQGYIPSIAGFIVPHSTLDDSQLAQVYAYGPLAISYGANPGYYFSGDPTLAPTTSDYRKASWDKAIQKLLRLLEAAYFPWKNGDIPINPDGTITPEMLAYFTQLGQDEIDAMVRRGECSGGLVVLNPEQKPLETATLEIEAAMQPTPHAETIAVNLGMALTL